MIDGINYQASPRYITVGTSTTQLCSGNVDRIALIISSPPVNRITLAWDSVVVSGNGLILNPGNPPLLLSCKWYGNVTTLPWFALADVGAQTIGIIEVIVPGINPNVDRAAFPEGALSTWDPTQNDPNRFPIPFEKYRGLPSG